MNIRLTATALLILCGAILSISGASLVTALPPVAPAEIMTAFTIEHALATCALFVGALSFAAAVGAL